MNLAAIAYLLLTAALVALGVWVGLRIGRRLGRADQQLEAPSISASMSPLTQTLQRVESYLHESTKDRAEESGALREQVRAMHDSQQQLGAQTSSLVNALRAPTVRGRWGEMQLRRIVESAGMLAHCDFVEQDTRASDSGGKRPDMVITLTGGRSIIVDAKVPFAGFIEAIDAPDERTKLAQYRAHAKQVRAHLDVLASKAYHASYPATPEFTVMFMPSDAFLQVALEHQPALLEYGFERDVVIATPSTLLAMLRTIAYTWRQDTLSREAGQVLDLGRQMHSRLMTMTTHLSKLGSSLDTAVDRYNQTVGSLERNVLVTARRFVDYGVSRDQIESPTTVDKRARELHVADPPQQPATTWDAPNREQPKNQHTHAPLGSTSEAS